MLGRQQPELVHVVNGSSRQKPINLTGLTNLHVLINKDPLNLLSLQTTLSVFKPVENSRQLVFLFLEVYLLTGHTEISIVPH